MKRPRIMRRLVILIRDLFETKCSATQARRRLLAGPLKKVRI